jgi:amidase
VIADWDALFTDWDVLHCPAVPVTAFEHCAPGTPMDCDGTPIESWRVDHFLYHFNYTGHPCVVIPAGQDARGLPIGVQLVGPRWHDERLLAIARAVDEVLGGYRRPPGF